MVKFFETSNKHSIETFQKLSSMAWSLFINQFLTRICLARNCLNLINTKINISVAMDNRETDDRCLTYYLNREIISIISMVSEFQIFVRNLEGKTYPFMVNNSTTIEDLKNKIHEKTGE